MTEFVPRTGLFQSTLPIREETASATTGRAGTTISIHSSHTGRDMYIRAVVISTSISIHSSHTGRDCNPTLDDKYLLISIHSSHTGRDSADTIFLHPGVISIHSSHTGRDERINMSKIEIIHFNPLFPYGKRHSRPARTSGRSLFQSTLPIREETANAYNLSARKVVASAQHRLIFDSSLLFPAVQNWFWG